MATMKRKLRPRKQANALPSRQRGDNLKNKRPKTARTLALQDDQESPSESSSDESEEEYKVKEVCDERPDGKLLVKWDGYDETTWEPKESIPVQFYKRFLRLKDASTKEATSSVRKASGSIKATSKKDTVPPAVKIDTEKIQPTSTSSKSISSEEKNCVVCGDEEHGGRRCQVCDKPVHHMCSNQLSVDLGVEEFLDVCYCSKSCYDTANPQVAKKALRRKVKKPTITTNVRTKPAGIIKEHENAGEGEKPPIQAPQVIDACVIGKNVAFSPSVEDWMPTRLYNGVGSLYVVGLITRQRKNGNGQPILDQFEVKWTVSQFQTKSHTHYISRVKADEGILNYQRMTGTTMAIESWDVLCKPFNEALNVNGPTGDIWDEFEEVEDTYVRYESNDPLPMDMEEVEKIKSMEFRADAHLAAPPDLFTHSDGSTLTRLKEDAKPIFQHSATSSFFAFLPLSFWRKVVENTNSYASTSKQPAISLEEMMQFLGILIFISTVDKGEYTNYWGDQMENKMFDEPSVGLERVMSIKRFKHIRKSLSFRDSVSAEDLKSDPAARIRPLMSMVKCRALKFVELGRNVAVDESSIACRSKFGRHLIVYNATKPTGKYHFKLYMCCCSTTWYAINFKLHCSSGLNERLEGVVDTNAIESLAFATRKSVEVRKHVVEVTLPIHKTKRIVNTDNYYTSCQLLETLKIVGLYGRGTIRENSKFGPKCFMLSKSDKVPRGTLRQGVSLQHKIVGASWADGSVVNILSNADPSTITPVPRQVGRTKVEYPAPTCIGEYNQGMQGVDRIDQLRSRFSIADGHTFKKWHKKLAMAIIDIARCNAYICRKMSGAVLDSRDPHREFVTDLCSELINGGWKNSLGDSGMCYSTPFNSTSIGPQAVAASPRLPSPSRALAECQLKHSKQVFTGSRTRRECVVCRFEGRNPSEQTVFCFNHNISLCASVRKNPSQQDYMCPDMNLTCWAKYHDFYFPAGLYNAKGKIRRSSDLFKAKKAAQPRQTISSLPVIDEDSELLPQPLPPVAQQQAFREQARCESMRHNADVSDFLPMPLPPVTRDQAFCDKVRRESIRRNAVLYKFPIIEYRSDGEYPSHETSIDFGSSPVPESQLREISRLDSLSSVEFSSQSPSLDYSFGCSPVPESQLREISRLDSLSSIEFCSPSPMKCKLDKDKDETSFMSLMASVSCVKEESCLIDETLDLDDGTAQEQENEDGTRDHAQHEPIQEQNVNVTNAEEQDVVTKQEAWV